MSCIVGIINLDGAPVDSVLLKHMTSMMENRAPHGNETWCSGHVGFGHAMLRISPESEQESQPCTLDGQVWITADVRIDNRTELIGLLRSAGQAMQRDMPDVDLILHAYRVYGESFLEYLIGDFAFSLWDQQNQKLICARDHFGVRPFYYTKIDNTFIFASDIDTLLEHPLITRQLNETFIADFILFGGSIEEEPTIYSDLKRLPAANYIVISPDEFYIRRYWSLPLHNEIHYRKHSEYLDQFQEVFARAVHDRLRSNHIALELSGGLDSSSIAVEATRHAKSAGRSVTGYTMTCRGCLPDDEEGFYAAIVASNLDIPLVCQESGDYALFERYDTPQLCTSEPFANPDLAMQHDRLTQVLHSGAHVILSGQGADALYCGMNPYPVYRLQNGQFFRFLAEFYQHVINTGSLAGMGLRSYLMPAVVRKDSWQAQLPDWLEPDFARRTQLKDRWNAGWREWNKASDTYTQLRRPWLSQMFDSYEVLKLPLVARHPFFDIRLIAFLMSLPAHMKSDKKIVREAMRGRLPVDILARPKTTLVGDHIRARLDPPQAQSRHLSNLTQVANTYIDSDSYTKAFEHFLDGVGKESVWSTWYIMAPVALDYWLSGHYTGTQS